MKLQEIAELTRDRVLKLMTDNGILGEGVSGNIGIRAHDFDIVGGRVSMKRSTMKAVGQGNSLKMPFKFVGLYTFRIYNRSIADWNDIPGTSEVTRIEFINCPELPPFSSVPRYKEMELEIHEGTKLDITQFISLPAVDVIFKNISANHPFERAVIEFNDGHVHCKLLNDERARIAEKETTDIFELQEWLIDNGLEDLT